MTVAGDVETSGWLTLGNAAIGGVLTNSLDTFPHTHYGVFRIVAVNQGESSTTVTAEGIVNQQFCSIVLSGNAKWLGQGGQVNLDIPGAAGFGTAGDLTGNVTLSGPSSIAFASGQITTIDGDLTLHGQHAVISDQASPGSNSALEGLTDIAAAGTLDLGGGKVQTSGALTNSGTIEVGDAESAYGHAKLLIGGGLTNDGTLALLGKTGYVDPISVVVRGAVDGSGAVDLSGQSTFEFDGSVGSGQALTFESGSAATLQLGHVHSTAESFGGTTSGFAAGDAIDLFGFGAGTTLGYSGSSASGVLTVTNGAHVETLALNSSKSLSDFSMTLGTHCDTLIKFV